MKHNGESFSLSASDLAGHLNCRHLTELEKAVALGISAAPKVWDPSLATLWERGSEHEASYLAHLSDSGLEVVSIDGFDVTADAIAATTAAMKAGKEIIAQAALQDGIWLGRADVLRRIHAPSELGAWSYEVLDTKLARETKGSTVLQISLYSDLVARIQGVSAEFMYVVPPWTEFEPQQYRVDDFAAYYRRVKRSLLTAVTDENTASTYPEPNPHCEICRWRFNCEQRRRDDDHLSLVAGISKTQRVELVGRGVQTTAQLSGIPLPISWKPERGSIASYTRVREQARVQVQARETGENQYELLPFEVGFGLSRLPAPSPGDVFLDFESDPFVGQHGLEYLIGYEYEAESGEREYCARWATTREQEKSAFEAFIDFIMQRWEKHPDLHIYHFGAYEVGALKRLMGRYGTREEELDRILRGLLPIDLHSVAKQSVRAGVESYSLKKLEPFYQFTRNAALPDVRLALTRLQTSLELNNPNGIKDDDYQTVQAYNREDCLSARELRGWLENLRSSLIEVGQQIERPAPGDGSPSENTAEWLSKITPLMEALTAGVPADPLERSPAQHSRWILAHMLEWHRREDKAVWWEYFRLSDLSPEELLDEKASLSGLTFEQTVGGTAACPIHRYRFPPQDADVRPEKSLRYTGGKPLGTVEDISPENQTIDIKKRKDTAAVHPEAAFVHDYVDPKPMQESILRLASYVIEHGVEGPGPYAAARELLLRHKPSLVDGSSLRLEGETTLAAGNRIAPLLSVGTLPIQGPPGTGKTHTGAHMICTLVTQGRKVGIVANSHNVIRNLVDKVIEAADETGVDLCCVLKPKTKVPDEHRLKIIDKAPDLFAALQSGNCQVAGGTAWLWASADAFETVDVLFVDEAAQMSLSNVLAVSQAARTLILIGDPQQLDQPTQGSHPEGTDCSAFHHMLDGRKTISATDGLFLDETWRLHPDICRYTSELFYEGKLNSKAGLELQTINSTGAFAGAGLRYVPIEHFGNQNASLEEADAVAEIVGDFLKNNATWTDRHGKVRQIGLEDILIIAPYNAQVFEIQRRIPGARVGTVDKFQGQQAPIAIYSLATSSHADAPRGMEFLYSLNRLNVATSRAKCLSILVSSPKIFEADCHTPRQMQLANAFCRYLELADDQSGDRTA